MNAQPRPIFLTFLVSAFLGACATTPDEDRDGVPDARDKCPRTWTSFSVDEAGCPLDSDADGVRNSQDRCPATPAWSDVDSSGCAVESQASVEPGDRPPRDQCIEVAGSTPGLFATAHRGHAMITRDGQTMELGPGESAFVGENGIACLEVKPPVLDWPCATMAAQSRLFPRYSMEELVTDDLLAEIFQRYFTVPEVIAPEPDWASDEYHGRFGYEDIAAHVSGDYWYVPSANRPLLSQQRPRSLLISLYVGIDRVVVDNNMLGAMRRALEPDDLPVTFIFNDANVVPISWFGPDPGLAEIQSAFLGRGIKVAEVPMWWLGDHHLAPTIEQFEHYFEIPALEDIAPGKRKALQAELAANGFSRKPLFVSFFSESGLVAVDQPERVRVAASMGYQRLPTVLEFFEPDYVLARCGPGAPLGYGAAPGGPTGSSGWGGGGLPTGPSPPQAGYPTWRSGRTGDKDGDGVADAHDLCPVTRCGAVDGNGCPIASSSLPRLQWPPPRSTTSIKLPRRFLQGANSLMDLSDRLSSVLSAAGYGEQSFYTVPAECGEGFALVTRLERFDETGAPLEDEVRFLPPDVEEDFDLTAFIKRLFVAPSGYFRFAIFVVTDIPFTPGSNEIDARQAQATLDRGATGLPRDFESASADNFSVQVLIYEYQWNPEREEAERTARLSAKVHLARSGLTRPLELE